MLFARAVPIQDHSAPGIVSRMPALYGATRVAHWPTSGRCLRGLPAAEKLWCCDPDLARPWANWVTQAELTRR